MTRKQTGEFVAQRYLFKSVVFIIFLINLIGCQFEGDGKYTTTGLFLRDHELVLPEFSLSKEDKHQYRFSNYCSWNNSFSVSLSARSETAIPWWELSTKVNLAITDEDGKVLLNKTSSLNSYHKRAVNTYGELKPYSHEWTTWYIVEGRYGEGRSKVARKGIEKKTIYYWNKTTDPIECFKDYIVDITVDKPNSSFPDIAAFVRIGSGWK